MRTILTSLLVLSLAPIAACGGSDGDDTKLVDVTPAQAKEYCLDDIEDHPSKVTVCDGESLDRGGGDAADCDTASPPNVNASCTATVDDLSACNDAIYDLTDAQYCDDSYLPPECDAIIPCFANETRTVPQLRAFVTATTLAR